MNENCLAHKLSLEPCFTHLRALTSWFSEASGSFFQPKHFVVNKLDPHEQNLFP